MFEDKKRCIDSFAVTANRIFILSCNGELLIKDKSSFDTISKVNVYYENKRPYYIKAFNDRLYIGYAKSFKDYSWADIGHVDISHSGIKKEHIKFMGLNINNVFDSIAFDENDMYIAYKAGCIIRIENKSFKQ